MRQTISTMAASSKTNMMQIMRGCICYTTVYRIWTNKNRTEGLTALCYLLFRNTCGQYSAQYSTVNLSGKSMAKLWGLNPDMITDTMLAGMTNSASVTGLWPSCPSDQHMLWKALLTTTLAKLRHRLGYHAYYTPVTIYIDSQTGLVTACEPVSGERSIPRPGLLKTDGMISVEESCLISTAMKHAEGAPLAHIKLSALKRTRQIPEFDMRLEIQTKEERFLREYKKVNSPYKKFKCDNNSNTIFKVVDNTLVLDHLQPPVRALSLVPTSFDCLVTTPAEFSLVALLATYAKWHEKLYSCDNESTNILVPILMYIGPETNPRGEDVDYSCIIGFPGWPIVKSSTANQTAIKDAIDAYVDTDGLWPLAGPRTFHLLAPWSPENHPFPMIDTSHILSVHSTDIRHKAADEWTTGRITCILRDPTLIENAAIAKFDFSAFFATLYLGLFPTHSRLHDVVKARLKREKPWLKQPILEFGGLLKKLSEDVYQSIISIGNHISIEVEATASSLMFAPCTYIKDGMWGTFMDKSKNVPRPPMDDERDFNILRNACAESANNFAATIGLQFPDEILLDLRLEGIYTHAMSWNANCYWLWNKSNHHKDFVGFPNQPRFASYAKHGLSTLLEKICISNDTDESLQTVREKTHEVFEELLSIAFDHRSDVSFWSCPTELYDDTQYIAALGMKAAARFDTSGFNRETVQTVTADGKIVSVTCSLFEGEIILPAIDCIDYMKPILAAFSRLLINVLSSKWDNVNRDDFTFDIESYRFMFINNK